MKSDKEISKLDLHIHSTVSDGTDAPGEILVKVKALGLQMFSVTDHDAIQAGKDIPPLLTPEDPAFVTGVEFNCKDKGGKYHILGYGFDPDNVEILKVVMQGHANRLYKMRGRLEFLKDRFGFTLSREETMELMTLDNPGKPHLAKLMVAHGFAKDIKEAISKYINQQHFEDRVTAPETAISGILAAGGIPILAHPSYGSGDELIVGEEMEARLRRMMDFGVQGVEAFYSGFTPRLENEILGYAEKYGLYVTAGSDYHGTNKMVVLGDNNLPEDPADWPEGLRRFLKDVRYSELGQT